MRVRPAPAPQLSALEQPQSLSSVNLRLGNQDFILQVADEDAELEKGLMFRKSMPSNEGMIFIFDSAAQRAFWMKNTLIDLDIVYLDRDAKIVSIKTMRSKDLTGIPSDHPAMYAIELNAGIAKECGLAVGQIIDLSPMLRPAAR
ncbi:MAG: DUF192 domain-containing protein [Burkholderiales bacterium]|nr:DUF192 domain-containing protein [Phycisphaerae bacterium]